MRTLEVPIYSFDELSDAVKARVLSRLCETTELDHDCIYEDAADLGALLGFDLRQRRVTLRDGGYRYAPAVFFSGFWSQGDGACFESSYRYAPGAQAAITGECNDETLAALAARLQALQKPHFYKLRASTAHRGHYYHEYCMAIDMSCECARCQGYGPGADVEEEFKEICADFARWIYRRLEAEYEYQTSDETLRELIEINEWEFYEDGRIV